MKPWWTPLPTIGGGGTAPNGPPGSYRAPIVAALEEVIARENKAKEVRAVTARERLKPRRIGYLAGSPQWRSDMLAIAGTGYGLIGLLVIILLVVLIFYFIRRA